MMDVFWAALFLLLVAVFVLGLAMLVGGAAKLGGPEDPRTRRKDDGSK
ncbi:MAG: hypothetical protein GY769_07850 [bacterium]|nr:hypothetical protein [bacterium]